MKKLLCLCAFLVPSLAQAAFANCAEAARSGFRDIPRGSYGYSADLDRDGDGVACESGGDDTYNRNTNPFYLPSSQSSTATVSAGNAPPVDGTATPVSPASPDPLAMKADRVVEGSAAGRVKLTADFTEISVELIGVDVPEAHRAAAQAWLQRAMPSNTFVYVEQDEVRTSPNGLPWVYLWAGMRLLNVQMVLAGNAVAQEKPINTKYLSFFMAAQATAKEQKIGLWKSQN